MIAAVVSAVAVCCFPLSAEKRAEEVPSDSLTVSLITCWPGSEIYELCGHEAIRVRGEGIDSVWNYGLFSFRQPNFVYRFVKGETDYMVGGYPWQWFMPEYVERGSRVEEQDLNLTQAEARQVLANLRKNALPENSTYRYNYVRNNCATRIVDVLEESVGQRIVVDDRPEYGSWRNEMRAYHKNYPWYQFGIDLALGNGLDGQSDGRSEMFVPVEMNKRIATSHFADGRQVVGDSRVLNQGRDDAVDGPTRSWLSPFFVSGVALLLSLCVVVIQGIRKKIYRIVYSFWFALIGLAGCVVTFLVFFSSHEAVSPNVLIIWLNPLQLIMAVTVWFRGLRQFNRLLMTLDCVAVGGLLMAWPLQLQSANPAFFPLMGVTIALSLGYAIISPPKGYNKGKGSRKKTSSRKKR